MVQSLGFLPSPHNARLRDESPLFAAGAAFARAQGGPLTRAFLDELPAGWADAHLVVDSHLVGVTPNADPGPMLFHREVYPEEEGGAFDLANRERDVQHVVCAFGPAMPEILQGEVDAGQLPDLPTRDRAITQARDEILRGWLAAGRLSLFRPQPGELVLLDGDTWLRWTRAYDYGLHFWIRATLGSRRPLVNGLRNCT